MGVVAPYMKNGAWYKPDSFQLILPGADGIYGSDPHGDEGHTEHDYVARDVAVKDTLSLEDWDNVTNFTNGSALDSEQD